MCVCVCVCTLCSIFCSFNLIINEEEFTKWTLQMKWTTSSYNYFLFLLHSGCLNLVICRCWPWKRNLTGKYFVSSFKNDVFSYWCQEERGENISVHQWVAHCCGHMDSPLKMHEPFGEHTLLELSTWEVRQLY